MKKTKAMEFCVVTMESERFSWAAVGKDRIEAMAALRKEWDRCARAQGSPTLANFRAATGCDSADPGEYYGVKSRMMKLGSAERD